MIQQVQHFLVSVPIFSLFLSLALGFALGRVKFLKDFSLGSTVGTLVVALIIGQAGAFTRNEELGTIFFGAFMFAVGYQVGPSFFVSMRLFGGRMVCTALIWLFNAFWVALLTFKLFHIGPGVGPGAIAGSLTQSATVASALQTIGSLPVSHAVRMSYEAQLPVAYALTYVFGTLGVIILLRDLAPKVLKIDLHDQGVRMARKYHFHAKNPNPTWRRTYLVHQNSPIVDQTIGDFNRFFDSRLVALAAFHGYDMTDKLDYKIRPGDRVTIIGYAMHFHELIGVEGLKEVLTPTNAPRERKFVLGRHFHPYQLATLRQHGVFINLQNPITGADQLINHLQPGDVISLTGNTSKTLPTLKKMGHWHTAETAINYSLFCLGIAGASVLGLLGLKVNGIPLQLGNGTAALLMGLLTSAWIDRHRNINSIPPAVTKFLQNFGLTLFVGMVGLQNARAFTSAMKALGWQILLIGAIISVMPHLITMLFAHYVLHMEPLALIGALCGSGTIAAAMNDISQRAGREGGAYVASAFTPAFVVGNIRITLFGPLFVALLSH